MWLLRRRKSNGDSAKAIEEATRHIREIKAREPEVNSLVHELKEIRAHNHFAEQLHLIMKKNGGIKPT